MTDDWLDQLEQLRQADKAKQQTKTETSAQSAAKKQGQAAAELLRRSKAHELLRQVQKTLLDGNGTLDIFEQASDYERVITLVWQGPISAARRPDPDDSEPYSYILVGVRKGHLWVNGRKVAQPTPEALKAALLKACQKPGRENWKK